MPIIDLEKIKKQELLPGFKARFVHSENLTIAFWDIKAGSILPKHSHINEQISHLTKGEFELTIGETVFSFSEGTKFFQILCN